MWALGYHVPEVHIASLDPEQLTIGDKATHLAQRPEAVDEALGHQRRA